MRVDEVVEKIKKIGICSREEIQDKILEAFKGYSCGGETRVLIQRAGYNSFIARVDHVNSPVINIFVDVEGDDFRVLDAWT